MRFPTVLLALVLASGCGGGVAESEIEVTDEVRVDEAAALQAMRDIHQAQSDFIARQRRYAQFIDELFDAGLLPARRVDTVGRLVSCAVSS